ncbi:MAG: Na+/H+ antiporter NhaC family protein [Bacillota bacterium]|nr:Na+/H+ antiporter NhaC family protein [Bacillota bacterium]
MDLLIAFFLFIAAVLCCLLLDLSVLYALLLGLLCFLLLTKRRGHSWASLRKMALQGAKTAVPVVKVMLCIGCLTALWRASGTISFFVYYGLELISPRLFLLIAFLLPALLSFLLGTSFGVCGTAGVVLMVLARGGGVDLLLTAGAVFSGAYFGDRCSPASSAGMLACQVTGVDHPSYVKMMLRSSLLPMLLCLLIYALLSYFNPIVQVDAEVSRALAEGFQLHWLCLLPALVLLILPWCRLRILSSLAISAVLALLLALFLQKQPLLPTLISCVFGWQMQGSSLAETLSGGGILSMASACGVVLLSNAYSGLFQGASLLQGLESKLGRIADRLGLFPTQLLCSILVGGVFCNQAIGTVMGSQLLGPVYREKGASSMELAVDIGSSIMTIAGLIPWSVASAVPLAMLGADQGALLYAVYLYAIPICYFFTKRLFFPAAKEKQSPRS